MHFQTLGFSLLLLSNLSFAAPGRAPAVEDFVGIEVELVEGAASETLFNLEQDVNDIESSRQSGPTDMANFKQAEAASEGAPPWTLPRIMGVLFILALPLVSWLHVLNHMRKKASEETASNIEVLSRYRQEREHSRNRQGSKPDDYRKVS